LTPYFEAEPLSGHGNTAFELKRVDDSEFEVTLMINWGREIPGGQRCDNRSEM
jgi:hypothetical protein